jgi:uncharacterized alpha-E superfamily protein
VANSIGSSIAQMPALMPFMPAVAKFLFDEELQLPSLATYWCGGAKERAFVLDHLDELVLRPAFVISSRQPLIPAEISSHERDALIEQIKADPHRYVAQQRPSRSTTPVWHDGEWHDWHAALRCFHMQSASGIDVLPGGLVRVSPDASVLDESPTSGRLGQDCWIVGEEPTHRQPSLLPSDSTLVKLTRGGEALPSRVAENLYWLGRSAERTEAIARLLRCTLSSVAGETLASEVPELPRMVAALAAMGQIEPDYAIAELAAKLPPLEQQLPASLFDQNRPRGLRAGVIDMGEKAAAVHDRMSLDAYRIITQVAEHLASDQAEPDAGTAINRLDGIITDLQALAGLASESMTRTHGWRFLQLGRRIERAYQTAELLAATLVDPIENESPLLAAVLQATDSLMTYQSRYLLRLQPLATIDLLVNDLSNPRSIGFHLQSIDRLLSELPTDPAELGLGVHDKLAQELAHAVRMSDPAELAQVNENNMREALDALLNRLIQDLPKTSDAIAARYLIHADATQELTGRSASSMPTGANHDD